MRAFSAFDPLQEYQLETSELFVRLLLGACAAGLGRSRRLSPWRAARRPLDAPLSRPARPPDFKQQAALDAFRDVPLAAVESAAKKAVSPESADLDSDEEDEQRDAAGSLVPPAADSAAAELAAMDAARLVDSLLPRIEGEARQLAGMRHACASAASAAEQALAEAAKAALAAQQKAGQAAAEAVALFRRGREQLVAGLRQLSATPSAEARQHFRDAEESLREMQHHTQQCLEKAAAPAMEASQELDAAMADALQAAGSADINACTAALSRLNKSRKRLDAAALVAAGYLTAAASRRDRMQEQLAAALALAPMEADAEAAAAAQAAKDVTVAAYQRQLDAVDAGAAGGFAAAADAMASLGAGQKQKLRQLQQRPAAGGTDLPSAVLTAGAGGDQQQSSSAAIDAALAGAGSSRLGDADWAAIEGLQAQAAQLSNEEAGEADGGKLEQLAQDVGSSSSTGAALQAAAPLWVEEEAPIGEQAADNLQAGQQQEK